MRAKSTPSQYYLIQSPESYPFNKKFHSDTLQFQKLWGKENLNLQGNKKKEERLMFEVDLTWTSVCALYGLTKEKCHFKVFSTVSVLIPFNAAALSTVHESGIFFGHWSGCKWWTRTSVTSKYSQWNTATSPRLFLTLHLMTLRFLVSPAERNAVVCLNIWNRDTILNGTESIMHQPHLNCPEDTAQKKKTWSVGATGKHQGRRLNQYGGKSEWLLLPEQENRGASSNPFTERIRKFLAHHNMTNEPLTQTTERLFVTVLNPTWPCETRGVFSYLLPRQ